MFSAHPFLILFWTPAILPMLSPKLRWLAGIAAVEILALTGLWFEVGREMSMPGYDGSPGDAIALAFVATAMLGAIAGCLFRFMAQHLVQAVRRWVAIR